MLRLFCLFFFGLLALSSKAQIQFCIDPPEQGTALSRGSMGVYDTKSTWDQRDIVVSFKEAYSSFITSNIKYYAAQWENYANIHFVFSQSTSNPDILIEIENDGHSWSRIGKVSRQSARQGEASMHFGWFNNSTPKIEFQRTVLHEFGHALGLCHEHQNPLGNIRWNKPVVYGYFCEKYVPHWTRDQVDHNIFEKLSVNFSNREYDPLSIMHYSFPADFTYDHFAAKENTELSEGDKKIIAEMYPKAISRKSSTAISAAFDSVVVYHNVTRDGVKGMEIHPYFSIENALNKICRVVGYFEDDVTGKALKDKNGSYSTKSGDVSIGEDFTPSYESSQFNGLSLFMPYDEFELGYGEYKLKFDMLIWNEGEEIARSAYTFFTYTSGPICKNIEVAYQVNNDDKTLLVTPKFTIKNAKGSNCRATVYFYDGDNILRNASGDIVSFTNTFTPGYDPAIYNQSRNDFGITVDYSALPLKPGTNNLRYFVSLYLGENNFAISGWNDITFTVSSSTSSNYQTSSIGFYKIRNEWTNGYINSESGPNTCSAILPGWWSAQWELLRINNTDHYFLKNKWRSDYLSYSDGEVTSTETMDETAEWVYEKVSGSESEYRFRHIRSGKYLHIEHGKLEVSEIYDGWLSARWFFEKI